MTDPVRIHFGYFKIDTDVWAGQRTGARHDQYTESLRDFAACHVFGDYWPAMDTSVRMQLWCAARGWPVCEGSPVYHDDACLTHPVTIVLASDAGRGAYALVQIEGQSPVIYADVTTDDGYWYQVQTVDIVCPSADHRWTWLDGRNLQDIDGRDVTLAGLFGDGPHAPYERCRDCTAFDNGRSDVMCWCDGTAIYCPACGQRCQLTLPDVPTHPELPQQQRGEPMSTPNLAGPVRRPLTAAELSAILSGIEAAGSTGELLATLVRATYDALLADSGRSMATMPQEQKVNPGDYAIPSTQWQALVTAMTNRAAQWGTGTELALEVINLMPGSYDDPQVPAPVLNLPDRRPYTHQLHVSRDATDVIAACAHRVQALAEYYGPASEQHQRAQRTWLVGLSRLFSMDMGADTRVSRDGELSLLVNTGSGYVYALIFHGDTRRCVTGDGCTAVIADDGIARTIYSGSVIAEHGHTPAFPAGAPRPGQWSFHS